MSLHVVPFGAGDDIVDQASGLVHKRHRRGKRRRTKRRLALRVTLSLVALTIAWALSAGIVHIVERPVPPFKGMAYQYSSGGYVSVPDVAEPRAGGALGATGDESTSTSSALAESASIASIGLAK